MMNDFNKKIKRILARGAIAVLLMTSLALSACGKKEDQVQESSVPETVKKRVEKTTEVPETTAEEQSTDAAAVGAAVVEAAPVETVEAVTTYSEFTTGNGFQGCTIDGVTYISGYVIANKTYSLPYWYAPGPDGTATAMFNQMSADAAAQGLSIWNQSNFRSYDTQSQIYWNYVSWDGQAAADTYSARPGHSEHQTGLAIDVNQINDTFIGTPEAIWLSDNCWKYGFILRYPSGKEWATGYKYESWHFRYMGDTDFCCTLYNNGDWISLEEYFGITSAYSY